MNHNNHIFVWTIISIVLLLLCESCAINRIETSAHSHVKMAKYYFEKKDYEKSIKHCNEAIELWNKIKTSKIKSTPDWFVNDQIATCKNLLARISYPKIKIFDLEVTVMDLRFFEGGHYLPDRHQRVYKKRFGRYNTRFIYWELNLIYDYPQQDIEFTIHATLYYKGKIISRGTHYSKIKRSWTSSWHSKGFGKGEAGNWQIGSYKVELQVDGKKIAIAAFEVF